MCLLMSDLKMPEADLNVHCRGNRGMAVGVLSSKRDDWQRIQTPRMTDSRSRIENVGCSGVLLSTAAERTVAQPPCCSWDMRGLCRRVRTQVGTSGEQLRRNSKHGENRWLTSSKKLPGSIDSFR